MLAYYSNISVDRVESDSPLTRGSIIVDIAKIYFAIMVVMNLLSALCDGENFGVPTQQRRPGRDIWAPLPNEVLVILENLGIFHLVSASSFHPAHSYRTVNLSCSIAGSRIGRPAPFCNVEFGRSCM